eukprot:jgi/Phyca11/13532/fgenesh1_pg.PHYCAscaffold_4_\
MTISTYYDRRNIQIWVGSTASFSLTTSASMIVALITLAVLFLSFVLIFLAKEQKILLVVAVNLILARILNGLVALEKHHTQSSLVVSRVTKIFLAQFCNTALLMLVINANANYFSKSAIVSETGTSNEGISLGALQILDGEYSDFSADWYNDVGVALMLTMIINSFNTQRDLEALYRGPKFDLAARYAQSLTTIFITYMFSAGMPLLHFIGFGAMIMTYWADKFILMHCVIAMWMFSNDRIFESENDKEFEQATMNSTKKLLQAAHNFCGRICVPSTNVLCSTASHTKKPR